MKVQQIFFNNNLRNFSYMITFDDGAIYCIDPFRAKEIRDFMGATLKLSGIINTHDHCDHYSGNAELIEAFSCSVMCHNEAVVPHKTRGLKDGEVVHRCGDWTLVSVYTPGHTLSHLCLVVKKKEIPYAVFTGDCFFNAGVGNCHNGGDVNLLYQTIEEIFASFSDDVLIYPGHEYLKRNLEFTMSIEKNNQKAESFLNKIQSLNLNETFFINDMKCERGINMFLRLDEEVIKENLKLTQNSRKAVFIRLRELRNKW